MKRIVTTTARVLLLLLCLCMDLRDGGCSAFVTSNVRSRSSTKDGASLLLSRRVPPSLVRRKNRSPLSSDKVQATVPITEQQQQQGQWTQILDGWKGVVTGTAIDTDKLLAFLLASPADLIGTITMIPLSVQAFRTAWTGEFATQATSYEICAAVSLVCMLSHLQMTWDTPRDYRAPRLAEPRTVYEFSFLYLIPFSWLLWRMTPSFPAALEGVDVVMCTILTAVCLYGALYPFYAARQLDHQCMDSSSSSTGGSSWLEPSTPEYRETAKLLCTGSIVINTLACLFIPFAWTLCIRGTEWWNRVQHLHPHQGAFLGVSVLVAILGDMSGNWLLRVKEFGIVRQYNSIVALGIVSNLLLLLFPEILFNGLYISGVSEVGFYWE